MDYISDLWISVAEGTLQPDRFCDVLKKQYGAGKRLPRHFLILDSIALGQLYLGFQCICANIITSLFVRDLL